MGRVRARARRPARPAARDPRARLAAAQLDDGDRLVHLDLHPMNVIMLTESGPVVIDWTERGARRRADRRRASRIVLLTCPAMPGAAHRAHVAATPMRAADRGARSRSATAGRALDAATRATRRELKRSTRTWRRTRSRRANDSRHGR